MNMILQDFFDKENININTNEYIINSFEDNYCNDDISVKFTSYRLSDCLYWHIGECYDRSLNKLKCLCLAFPDSMELMWESCTKLRKILKDHGYELFIMDQYIIHGNLLEYDTLNENEIKEFLNTIKEDWFMFIQIKDKLITVIDDEFNYDEGYWNYKDHLTCYIYNVNLNNNINRLYKTIRNKIKKHICNH